MLGKPILTHTHAGCEQRSTLWGGARGQDHCLKTSESHPQPGTHLSTQRGERGRPGLPRCPYHQTGFLSMREGGSLSHGFCYSHLRAAREELGTRGGVRGVRRAPVLAEPEAGSLQDSLGFRSV